MEALAVVTTWRNQGPQDRNFFAVAKEKKLHPDYLSAADLMVHRVLLDEGLYMPQCADPWHWQCGPDDSPEKSVYYNQALACTFNPWMCKWFAPRFPVHTKPDTGSGALAVGDIDSAIVYLVLNCCALTIEVGEDLLPTQDRFLSNPYFFGSDIFQKCADKCPETFGVDSAAHKLFYVEKKARDKTHKKNLAAAMMQAYKQVWDGNKHQ